MGKEKGFLDKKSPSNKEEYGCFRRQHQLDEREKTLTSLWREQIMEEELKTKEKKLLEEQKKLKEEELKNKEMMLEKLRQERIEREGDLKIREEEFQARRRPDAKKVKKNWAKEESLAEDSSYATIDQVGEVDC